MTRPTPTTDQVECDLAHPIELRHRDHVLVRRDLKHTVRGGVDDRLSGPHVLDTETVDDLGARRDDIAEDAAANPGLEFGDHGRREALRKRRERPTLDQAHHLPMAGHRVLPCRRFGHAPICAFGRLRVATAKPRNPAKPQRAQSRDAQRDLSGDVAKCVASFVAVEPGVGELTAPNAVEHDQDDARERCQVRNDVTRNSSRSRGRSRSWRSRA
jgi:hypothetical protein